MMQGLVDAIEAGDLAAARAALDAGAEVDVRVDKYETTPLMKAAKAGQVDLARLLLARGADANASDTGKCTPLLYALSGGLEMAGLVLDAGGAIEAQSQTGYTILMTAIVSRKPEIAALLVARGADVGRRDPRGVTALHYAALFGTPELVEVLLTAGADVLAKTTAPHPSYPFKKGATAFDIARSQRNKPLMARLEAAMTAAGGPKAPTLAEVLAQVERDCLGGEPAPDALRGLWAAELADESLLQDTRYGEVELVTTMEDFFSPEFLADGLSEAMKARLAEIRFFGREADSNFLGLWKHRADLPISEAPVIMFDNEGTFRLTAPTIQDHFFMTARYADGGEAGKAVKALKKLYKEYAIPAAKTEASIKSALRGLPDPEAGI